MAYFECPGFQEIVYPFGTGAVRALAERYGLHYLGQLPLDPLNGGRDVITSDDSPAARMTGELTDTILETL